MDKSIIEIVLTQGIFTCLFVWLLFDTKNDSKEREIKYQETIDKLADTIRIVENIKEDIQEIKNRINK